MKNKYSSKRYIISTAEEIGKDYWTIVIFPSLLFGLFPNLSKPIATLVRNNKEDAHKGHWEVKKVVSENSEDKWVYLFPSPKPPEGYTEDTKRTFREKLGYIPE